MDIVVEKVHSALIALSFSFSDRYDIYFTCRESLCVEYPFNDLPGVALNTFAVRASVFELVNIDILKVSISSNLTPQLKQKKLSRIYSNAG